MQTAAELDAPQLPVESVEFAANPHRFFRDARTKHPWLARSSMGLLTHEYTAIRELLGQDDKFLPAYGGIVEALGAHGTPWGRFTEEQMVSMLDLLVAIADPGEIAACATSIQVRFRASRRRT